MNKKALYTLLFGLIVSFMVYPYLSARSTNREGNTGKGFLFGALGGAAIGATVGGGAGAGIGAGAGAITGLAVEEALHDEDENYSPDNHERLREKNRDLTLENRSFRKENRQLSEEIEKLTSRIERLEKIKRRVRER